MDAHTHTHKIPTKIEFHCGVVFLSQIHNVMCVYCVVCYTYHALSCMYHGDYHTVIPYANDLQDLLETRSLMEIKDLI